MPKFTTIIFDLDGTILDTSEGIISSVEHTINQFNLPKLNKCDLKKFIGPPLKNTFNKFYNLKEKNITELVLEFRKHYKEFNIYKAKPYCGIYDLLVTLIKKNIKPVVATYKRQDLAELVLNHFNINKYLFFICGADYENKLSKKDIIINAISICGELDKNKIIMVGDSENDAIGAFEVGLNFVGVTYGFGFKNKKEVLKYNPYGIASSIEELKDILISE